ncbi:class II glutamine amidotransferase [Thiobacillus denitrificans]|uniref:class II glutamine amidotransferase n=1 Tax=Thiobacillus denitrificans TaxID=36861 RepID=UPI0009E761FC|nr:class II glutamine amidotransferase [Thiobacillus denitrificans]
MCELFGASSSTPRSLSRWLRPFRLRGGESADNPDGWGIAFWSGGHPNIEKSPEPGWSSTHFLQLSENLASDLVIAHVRKARHPPVPSVENTHPFVHPCCGREWVFAHNGLVSDVAESAPNPSCHPVGETDSEHAFCQILAGIAGTYATDDHQPWLNALNRLADAIATRGKFNFLLSDGRILMAYGHDRLHYLESSDGRGSFALVATEPLADGPWQPFADQELRVYKDGVLLARYSPQGFAQASSELPDKGAA